MSDSRPGEPGPEEPGREGEWEFPEEEWESRLRRPVSPLPPPPGAFDRVSRAARTRRRVRATGAGTAAALAAACLVAVPLAVTSGGFDTVTVRPPAAGPVKSGSPAEPPQGATESSAVIPTGPAQRPPGTGDPGTSARPSTPGPVRSTTPAPALPACGTGRLKAEMTAPVPGTAYGSRTAELVLTNTSPGSCVLAGIPELALFDGERAPIETETVPRATATPLRLVVPAGGTVRAALAWTTVPEADELLGCFPVPAWLRVRPPGGLTWLETGWRGQEVCGHGRVELGPLRREP